MPWAALCLPPILYLDLVCKPWLMLMKFLDAALAVLGSKVIDWT